MVYRIFVEKKTGLDNEAKGLLNEARKRMAEKYGDEYVASDDDDIE